jgi:hypothetical protein
MCGPSVRQRHERPVGRARRNYQPDRDCAAPRVGHRGGRPHRRASRRAGLHYSAREGPVVRIPPPANLDGGKASPAGPISPWRPGSQNAGGQNRANARSTRSTLGSERPFLWYERVRPRSCAASTTSGWPRRGRRAAARCHWGRFISGRSAVDAWLWLSTEMELHLNLI